MKLPSGTEVTQVQMTDFIGNLAIRGLYMSESYEGSFAHYMALITEGKYGFPVLLNSDVKCLFMKLEEEVIRLKSSIDILLTNCCIDEDKLNAEPLTNDAMKAIVEEIRGTKQMDVEVPECPNCKSPLEEVAMARSVLFELGPDKNWIESNVYSEEISCTNCDELLDRDLFENFVPLPDSI